MEAIYCNRMATDSGESTPLISQLVSHRKKSMVTDKQLHASFLWISFLFAINHGALLSCLGLASARLGSHVASASSSTLYIFNTGFALLGAPFIVKRVGPHSGLIIGMCMCATYVASFWGVVAICNTGNGEEDDTNDESLQQTYICSETISIIGSVIGGVGSAILWTSQGSFFSSLCTQYSHCLEDRSVPFEKVTSKLGGEWAFMFLFVEVWMRILSTILANGMHTSADSEDAWFNHGMDWEGIFGVYSILGEKINEYSVDVCSYIDASDSCIFPYIAFGAAILMNCVTYHDEETPRSAIERSATVPTDDNIEDLILQDGDEIDTNGENFESEGTPSNHLQLETDGPSARKSPFRQAVAAVDLLIHDNKMKYLWFINITVSQFHINSSAAMH